MRKHKKHKEYKNRNDYVVYDIESGEIVLVGSAKECSEFMGMTKASFYCHISRLRSGMIKKGRKYVAYVIEEDEEK